jgi:hypothetical protein
MNVVSQNSTNASSSEITDLSNHFLGSTSNTETMEFSSTKSGIYIEKRKNSASQIPNHATRLSITLYLLSLQPLTTNSAIKRPTRSSQAPSITSQSPYVLTSHFPSPNYVNSTASQRSDISRQRNGYYDTQSTHVTFPSNIAMDLTDRITKSRSSATPMRTTVPASSIANRQPAKSSFSTAESSRGVHGNNQPSQCPQ